ncbi:hypothetical protein GGD81_004256 [Rhodobium orientis]|uniref:hypothetical protein n=1 Tax=Rhodobium orientis TaxID=34017 RepID=UPI0011B937C0|nr:hypothetical protein [Rhodobium orientis]MBB4305187.1 hypothetical protein [Rhodobium orientis]
MSPALQKLLSDTLLDRALRKEIYSHPDLLQERFDLTPDEVHYVISQLDRPSDNAEEPDFGMKKYTISFPENIEALGEVETSENAVRLSNPDYYVRPVTVVTTTTTVNTVTVTTTTTTTPTPTEDIYSSDMEKLDVKSSDIIDLATKIRSSKKAERLPLVRSLAKAVASR